MSRHLGEHVVAFRQVAADPGVRDVRPGHRHAPGLHDDRAWNAADRIRGVGDQVHDHLADLRRITVERRQRVIQLEDDLRVLRHGRPQQMRHLADDVREVGRLQHEAALAGVGQHLVGQFGRALRGRLNLRRSGRRPATPGSTSVERESGVSEHADEEIVEVVRDAAGQHAEALELLHVLHLRFETAPLFFGAHAIGDVAVAPDAAVDMRRRTSCGCECRSMTRPSLRRITVLCAELALQAASRKSSASVPGSSI